MKFLKESYGQSTDLDDFIYNLHEKYGTYYVVSIDDGGRVQDEYFVFEEDAREYFEKAKVDVQEYGWDNSTVTLKEVKVKEEMDSLDEFTYDKTEDEVVETEVESPIDEPEEVTEQ